MRAPQIEKLAKEILDWLEEKELWIDVRVYYNGKVVYEKDKVERADPRDYFEFVGDILSMSFEGGLYDVFNGTSTRAYNLQEEFNEILKGYGVYYELGNAWNLTLYEE